MDKFKDVIYNDNSNVITYTVYDENNLIFLHNHIRSLVNKSMLITFDYLPLETDEFITLANNNLIATPKEEEKHIYAQKITTIVNSLKNFNGHIFLLNPNRFFYEQFYEQTLKNNNVRLITYMLIGSQSLNKNYSVASSILAKCSNFFSFEKSKINCLKSRKYNNTELTFNLEYLMRLHKLKEIIYG